MEEPGAGATDGNRILFGVVLGQATAGSTTVSGRRLSYCRGGGPSQFGAGFFGLWVSQSQRPFGSFSQPLGLGVVTIASVPPIGNEIDTSDVA